MLNYYDTSLNNSILLGRGANANNPFNNGNL